MWSAVVFAEEVLPTPPGWIETLGVVATLTMVLALWLTGRLIRAQDHREQLAVAVARAERAEVEAAAWKEAYHEQTRAREAAEAAGQHVTDMSEITLRLLGAFESAVSSRGREAG